LGLDVVCYRCWSDSTLKLAQGAKRVFRQQASPQPLPPGGFI